jgi:hypothetical protein
MKINFIIYEKILNFWYRIVEIKATTMILMAEEAACPKYKVPH